MTTFTLPAVCDRAAARALHPDLRDAIGNAPLTIDASAVERIGQAMLQLLVAAARSEAGIILAAPSPFVIEAVERAALMPVLGEDIAYPAETEQAA